jgi:hypothetical protein
MPSKLAINFRDTKKKRDLNRIIKRVNQLKSIVVEQSNTLLGSNTGGGIGGGIGGGGTDSGGTACGNASYQEDNNLWQLFPIALDEDAQMTLAYSSMKNSYSQDNNISDTSTITNYMLYEWLQIKRGDAVDSYLDAYYSGNNNDMTYWLGMLGAINTQIGWVNCTVNTISVNSNTTSNLNNVYTINANAAVVNNNGNITGNIIGDNNLIDSNGNILQITVNVNNNIAVVSQNVNYLNNGNFIVATNEDPNVFFNIEIKSIQPILINPNYPNNVTECAKYTYTYAGSTYSACPANPSPQTNSLGCYIWNPFITQSSGSGSEQDTSNSGTANYDSIPVDNNNDFAIITNNPQYKSTTRRYASSGR